MYMRIVTSLACLFFLAGCAPTGLLTIGVPGDKFSRVEDIAYQSGDRHRLDIYEPKQTADGKPVVVFFYGGEWRYGNKEGVRFVAEPLAAAGITVVVPDYRLSPEVTFPAFIDDGAAAVAWTRSHIADYGGNPKHIFVMGHSAGAYISAMLALDPEYLKKVSLRPGDLAGAIGIAGPYNFLPITWPELKPIFEVVPDLNTTQPITFANGKNPPLLLAAGLDDDTVNPITNTDALYKKVLQQGGKATEKLYPDVGHIGIILAFSPLFCSNAPVLDDTISFIEENTLAK